LDEGLGRISGCPADERLVLLSKTGCAFIFVVVDGLTEIYGAIGALDVCKLALLCVFYMLDVMGW
jgi:hypothetical protein